MLFVETQGQTLAGLRSSLNVSRPDWNILQVMDKDAALELVSQRSIGIVFANFGLDIAACEDFFRTLKDQVPEVIRMGLLPDRNKDTVIKSLAFAHECVATDCDSAGVEVVIDRGLSVWERTRKNPRLAALMADLHTLPTPPALYFDIREELESPNGSVHSVARIIAHDPAITAKLLKLANSGFYASPRSISDLHEAVSLLGMDMVLAVVLAAYLFDQLPLPGVNLDVLWKHSVAVASLAKEIACEAGGNRTVASTCGIAGLLHDLGQLIFLANAAQTYYGMVRRSGGNERMLLQMEVEEYGVGHPELAGHILSLWGLPDEVVEAIANHHGGNPLPFDKTPIASRSVCIAEWLLQIHNLEDELNFTGSCLESHPALAESIGDWQRILDRLVEQGLVQQPHNPADHLFS
jgi:putative nucleotidyltransferase with HDIG domain